MKKLLLNLLCVPLIGFGQNIRYTVFSGVNYAYPVGENIEDWRENIEDMVDLHQTTHVDYDASGGIYGKYGLNLGIDIDYNIKDNLFISSGISYSERGFKATLNTVEPIFSPVGDVFISMNIVDDIDAKLNYIDLPILLKYHINDSYFISGGAIFCFLINESVEFNYSRTYPDIPVDLQTSWIPFHTNDIKDWDDSLDDRDPGKTIIGAQLVIGCNIAKYNLSFKINKTGSFGEIDGNDGNQHLTLQLCVGYHL